MANSITPRESLLNLRVFLEDNLPNVGTISTTNTPAIWVEPPYLTDHQIIDGVAVIISRYKQNVNQKFSPGSPQAFKNFDWQFVVRAYDMSEDGLRLYDSTLETIHTLFSDFRSITLESRENVFPQTRFLLKTHLIVNLKT